MGRGSRWGRRWAKGVVQQFEKDQSTGAFYDPQNPGDAFLLKQPSVLPYLFVLMPAILGIGGMAVLLKPSQPMPEPIKRRRGEFCALAWYGIGVLCAGHYFALAGSQSSTLALPIFGAYALLGFVPLLFALPSEGWGGRFQAAAIASLIGAFLGFWIGLCSGWVAAFLSESRHGGPIWIWYGVLLGTGVLGLLGLVSGKMESRS